jgi:hypothetical protein
MFVKFICNYQSRLTLDRPGCESLNKAPAPGSGVCAEVYGPNGEQGV